MLHPCALILDPKFQCLWFCQASTSWRKAVGKLEGEPEYEDLPKVDRLEAFEDYMKYALLHSSHHSQFCSIHRSSITLWCHICHFAIGLVLLYQLHYLVPMTSKWQHSLTVIIMSLHGPGALTPGAIPPPPPPPLSGHLAKYSCAFGLLLQNIGPKLPSAVYCLCQHSCEQSCSLGHATATA